MNVSSFKESLSENEPPKNCSVYLNALWYDAKGEWDKAHKLIQDVQIKMHHGYMPIFLEKKVLIQMQIIDIATREAGNKQNIVQQNYPL